MRHDLVLCRCGYPRAVDKPCTACAPEALPHVLVDTPANQEALRSLAVQLYNALGEVQRQFANHDRTVTQSAALAYGEMTLLAARGLIDARSNSNAVELAFDVAPGKVAKALRAIGRKRKEGGKQKH